jgi:hypothetical protein
VKVTVVELRDIQLPESMQRAMARQAEAKREKRAKIIAAQGEALAAGELAAASDVMMAHPLALQLRNLQTGSKSRSTRIHRRLPRPADEHDRRARSVHATREQSCQPAPRHPRPADTIHKWGGCWTHGRRQPDRPVRSLSRFTSTNTRRLLSEPPKEPRLPTASSSERSRSRGSTLSLLPPATATTDEHGCGIDR